MKNVASVNIGIWNEDELKLNELEEYGHVYLDKDMHSVIVIADVQAGLHLANLIVEASMRVFRNEIKRKEQQVETSTNLRIQTVEGPSTD